MTQDDCPVVADAKEGAYKQVEDRREQKAYSQVRIPFLYPKSYRVSRFIIARSACTS